VRRLSGIVVMSQPHGSKSVRSLVRCGVSSVRAVFEYMPSTAPPQLAIFCHISVRCARCFVTPLDQGS